MPLNMGSKLESDLWLWYKARALTESLFFFAKKAAR
jgi:hypothetical protein